ESTTDFRTQAWQTSLRIWASRPALGHGPGQSAVRIAASPIYLSSFDKAGTTLGTAEGIWAASLIDAGVLGLAAWLALFATIVFVTGRVLIRGPTTLRLATFAATLTALLGAQVAEDRIEMRIWVVLALALATALAAPL